MNDIPADGFIECHCTGVSRAQVQAAFAAGCTTVDEVRRRTGACSGCGSCRPELQALLTALAKKQQSTSLPNT